MNNTEFLLEINSSLTCVNTQCLYREGWEGLQDEEKRIKFSSPVKTEFLQETDTFCHFLEFNIFRERS